MENLFIYLLLLLLLLLLSFIYLSPDITRNWTQGYLVLYVLQITQETPVSPHCHRVQGMVRILNC